MIDRVAEVLEIATTWLQQGATVYFKWTCASCGARLTLEQPNTLFTEGRCDDCGHVMDLLNDPAADVNYLLVLEIPPCPPTPTSSDSNKN